MGNISLISLGCPKNLVDSENLLKRLESEGIYYSSNPEGSDIIMVNTCGFIKDAKKESIETILNLAKLKEKDKGKKIVVLGCLAERYGDGLKKEMPEIDAMWGLGEEEKIVEYCKEMVDKLPSRPTLVRGGKGGFTHEEFNGNPYAYLKIAEGCNRGCSYCVIPQIRGRFRSRAPDNILKEAEEYINSGKKELILVAQDITSYGKDIKGYNLARLIGDIASVGGDFWIRLLYLYPTAINDKLLETINSEKKVCKYIDMPIQHSEEKIISLMRRVGSRKYFENLISRIRDAIPDANIRTTLMVGFPDETSEDFEKMTEFVHKIKFERLGVFRYSKEEGTPAHKMIGQVPERIKRERYNKIMEIQSAISLEKNMQLIGKTFKAIVDEVEDSIAVARLYSQAPDIDGVVLIHDSNVRKGGFVNIRIEDAYDYDLTGTIVR